MQTEGIVTFLKVRANRDLVRDIDFFKKMEAAQEQYGPNFWKVFINKNFQSNSDKRDIVRELAFIYLAHELGYVNVNYQSLYELDAKFFKDYVSNVFEKIRITLPEIVEIWDKRMEKKQNKSTTYEQQ